MLFGNFSDWSVAGKSQHSRERSEPWSLLPTIRVRMQDCCRCGEKVRINGTDIVLTCLSFSTFEFAAGFFWSGEGFRAEFAGVRFSAAGAIGNLDFADRD